jgi:transposase
MTIGALSEEEVRKRLVRLRNLEYLHKEQKLRNEQLVTENRQLNSRVTALERENTTLKNTVEDLKLQIEELRTIVFGKKRKKNDGNEHDDLPPIQPHISSPRTRESYKRKLPEEGEITETQDHPINVCTQCHGQFSERDVVTYIEEDIPLPQKRTVIKHLIEKGYCDSCRIWSTSVSLPTTDVILGNNVKRYVSYLSVIARQSYTQIQDILKRSYDFDISQGEIAKILDHEGERLRPEYERLKARIRGEPSVHLDETSWHLLMGDGYRRYAWTMVGGVSSEAAFVLGKTRGKGNADDLLGDSKAVVVSDDYAAYRNLKSPHQLCCAHILRKLRDIATSSEITGAVHDHCVMAYKTFANIYADIEAARTLSDPQYFHNELTRRLQQFVHAHPNDPAKLTRIKEQVAPRIPNYITCLLYPNVASDNNAAERSLRHLVLKRKISFGSLSEKTADTLAILLSVLMSHKQRGTLREYLMGV